MDNQEGWAERYVYREKSAGRDILGFARGVRQRLPKLQRTSLTHIIRAINFRLS